MSAHRIFVTGVAGYIGSLLVRLLLEEGFDVIGIDSLLYGDEAIHGLRGESRFTFIHGDIREPASYVDVLKKVDGVVHLAAIVGEQACIAQPDFTLEVNVIASKQLFEAARNSTTVNRFVFASTCSNYGASNGDGYCREKTKLEPIGLYADTKVAFEKHILESKRKEGFSPTILRFATAYGLSPRMRFDLTVNEFTREVAVGEELLIFNEALWRPYCHAEDLARACLAVLKANAKLVDHEVFNVGDTGENYTKKQLANLLLDRQPKAKIRYISKNEKDVRNYKVSFQKIGEVLSFDITKKVPDGIEEIFKMVEAGEFNTVESKQYRNA